MRDPSHIVPKALAVFALGPFAFGIWWLNWVVTQENLQRSKVFQACLASVTADVDGKRFVECEWAGQRVRAALPTAKPFRSWQAGEQHAVLMDPAPPHSFTNGGLVELWASTGMLSFLEWCCWVQWCFFGGWIRDFAGGRGQLERRARKPPCRRGRRQRKAWLCRKAPLSCACRPAKPRRVCSGCR